MDHHDTNLQFELSMTETFQPVRQERLIRDTAAIQRKLQEQQARMEQVTKDTMRIAMLRNALFRSTRSSDVDRLGPDSL